MKVLITGAAGFIGSQLLEALAVQRPEWTLIASDLRTQNAQTLRPNTESILLDISQHRAVMDTVATHKPDAIVHLASVLNPPPGMSDAVLHAIDVEGTRSILQAAAANGGRQLIVSSSGAAYGYYPENAEWIDENDPLRGHAKFAYARHKREVEEILAEGRVKHPEVRQLILRPGTVLGKRVNNQITDMFKKKSILGIKGCDSRFVFIWDQDVISVIGKGLEKGCSGIYNLAGDGALSLSEIADIMQKPYRQIPPGLLQFALRVLKPLRLTQYGPEQLDFLRYRPVLANRRLKEEFGYTPRYTSRDAFIAFLDAQGIRHV